ncbi:hypothetical protein H0O00_03460 [Candidatus Micrarchaeota archaeon]|nr:hypothetical protein [Candidatus Micrarchaeota archaeon]
MRHTPSACSGVYSVTLILLLLIPLSMAAEANITYHLNLEMESSCPDDILNVDAIASNGEPASDVELRLVLYYPYQGLRALKHTDTSGHTFFELTRNGTYRIYINTEAYDHEQYEVFDYPESCPPPPPKQMNATVAVDCGNLAAGGNAMLTMNVTEGGIPLKDVFARSLHWSSMSSSTGAIALPLEQDDYFVIFEKEGYTSQTVFLEEPCVFND